MSALLHGIQNTIQIRPPLLNPKEVDYGYMTHELALELRLPPKMPYKFVVLRYCLSGGLAITGFLERCNIPALSYSESFNAKHNLDYSLYISCVWSRDELPSKTLCLLRQNDSILMIVRDPISRIKTACNHGSFKNHDRTHDDIVEFTMEQSPYDVVDARGFFDEYDRIVANQPYAHNTLIKHFIKIFPFCYYSHTMLLSKDSKITYLDMQEIMPDRAFETMQKLAKEFGFQAPKNEDRGFYEAIAFGNFTHILPLICIVKTQDNKTLKIHIDVWHNAKESLTTINHILFSSPHPLLSKIVFSMSKEDLESLQQDSITLSKVKEYMPKFLNELQKRTDYVQRNKVHERDVLEIFRGDRDLRNKFKAMLDRELTHIKQHRPDIIESWNYYKEFEEICKEEGSV